MNEEQKMRKVHFPIEQTVVVGYGKRANVLFNTAPYWSEHILELAVEIVDEDEPYLLLENPKVERVFRVTVEVDDITEEVKNQEESEDD